MTLKRRSLKACTDRQISLWSISNFRFVNKSPIPHRGIASHKRGNVRACSRDYLRRRKPRRWWRTEELAWLDHGMFIIEAVEVLETPNAVNPLSPFLAMTNFLLVPYNRR